MNKLQGILPAIVTPTDPSGIFQLEPFERLLAFVYEQGVDGLYVCGQTGEGLQQSIMQRKLVAEAATRYSPTSKTVMVHVGAASTADAVDLARHAESVGAHALSALPPIGNYSFVEVKSYYQTLVKPRLYLSSSTTFQVSLPPSARPPRLWNCAPFQTWLD